MTDSERKQKWYADNRELVLSRRKLERSQGGDASTLYRRRVRAEALVVLGNKCRCCGFDDPRALQVDHREGGGHQEWLRLGSYGIYRRVIKHPEDYHLLCANCNWIKRVEEKEYGRKTDSRDGYRGSN